MDQPTTIGLDLAKSVFHLHGVSADGTAVLRRQLRRSRMPGLPCASGPLPDRDGSVLGRA